MIRRLAFALLLACGTAAAADFDYGLVPRQVAPDTYVFRGRDEDFSARNGGNILNTGFIVTSDGVVVVDTGPSLRYGEQMRAAIRKVSDRPVVRVLITHHHPDHFLGNQAYADVGPEALPATIAGIRSDGAAFADNMYRLNGEWMRNTEAVPPARTAVPGRFSLGGHEFELLALGGHTAADLALLDHTTGVLFAGDLVFFDRAATTPHADAALWLATLANLQRLPYRVLVPGHGEPVTGDEAIRQTRDYLEWLTATLKQAAADGLDMGEALLLPLPERFARLALARHEFQRSVSHLYPQLEQAVLEGAPR